LKIGGGSKFFLILGGQKVSNRRRFIQSALSYASTFFGLQNLYFFSPYCHNLAVRPFKTLFSLPAKPHSTYNLTKTTRKWYTKLLPLVNPPPAGPKNPVPPAPSLEKPPKKPNPPIPFPFFCKLVEMNQFLKFQKNNVQLTSPYHSPFLAHFPPTIPPVLPPFPKTSKNYPEAFVKFIVYPLPLNLHRKC